MLNRTEAVNVFNRYTESYDHTDVRIMLKIKHTYRVAALCERIAESLNLSKDSVDFAWFLGLLHDIGRFEQVRQYGTFHDADSVDHAEFGADLLFHDGLIRSFPEPEGIDAWETQCETAVRVHNKLKLPEGLDETTAMFCNILRDADKIDIFRVTVEIPLKDRMGTSVLEEGGISESVMKCVREHRCVPRGQSRTPVDKAAAHCCMAFELVYEESRTIVREQRYLEQILSSNPMEDREWTSEDREALRVLRRELVRTGVLFETK